MKKERIWTFLKKISKLKLSCRRGILTRAQVGDFQVAIQDIVSMEEFNIVIPTKKDRSLAVQA